MFKIDKLPSGKKQYWFFKKIRLCRTRFKGFEIFKGNSSIWIDVPFLEIKIKRNYKGHSIS